MRVLIDTNVLISAALDKFLSVVLLILELVPIPTEEDISETQIRSEESYDYDTGRISPILKRRGVISFRRAGCSAREAGNMMYAALL